MGTPQRSPRLQAGQQQQISVIPVKSKTRRKKGEPLAWQTTPLKTPSWDEEVPTAGNPLGQTSPLSQTSPPRTRVALSHPRSHLGGRALAATPTPALLMPSRQTRGTPRLWSCCAGEGWERSPSRWEEGAEGVSCWEKPMPGWVTAPPGRTCAGSSAGGMSGAEELPLSVSSSARMSMGASAMSRRDGSRVTEGSKSRGEGGHCIPSPTTSRSWQGKQRSSSSGGV